MKNITIVDKVIVHEYEVEDSEPFKFCFIPFVPNGRFEEALNSSGECWDICDCIFAHQEFEGCKMGAFTSECGDLWDEEYPMVISGHIHEHQCPSTNIFYTGSALQHGWDDDSEKGIWHFTFTNTDEGLEHSYELYPIKLKPKKIIKIDYEDLKNFDIEKYTDYAVKLDIKCRIEQFKNLKNSSLYKKLIANGVKIVNTPVAIERDLITQAKTLKKDKVEYLDILKELCGDELKDVLKEVVDAIE
jgi:DNA repair exonuclease SbcCD nuclease subunit